MTATIKLMVVVGARPQFIKAAALSWAIREWNADKTAISFEEIIIHTGQHYDYELSQSFFEELEIPEPAVNLGVGSASHAVQTAEMLIGLERQMQERSPDWVIVYGDTNSTLAGVLTAAKLKIEVAHVEAGLREHNRRIPEEINKIVADHLSTLCFAPTEVAMQNLKREGLAERSLLVGDIMLDTTLYMLERLSESCAKNTLARFGLRPDSFILATTHRAIMRENPDLLRDVLEALREIPFPVILPLHPATRSSIERFNLAKLTVPDRSLIVVPPVQYATMLVLLQNCRAVITDSGGLIKEAYYFQKPCITIDYQTEWEETLEGGWNVVTGPNKSMIIEALASMHPDPAAHRRGVFGDGRTASKILKTLSATG
jgi:UDP-N-acetylglucosamine 2-epimerase